MPFTAALPLLCLPLRLLSLQDIFSFPGKRRAFLQGPAAPSSAEEHTVFPKQSSRTDPKEGLTITRGWAMNSLVISHQHPELTL